MAKSWEEIKKQKGYGYNSNQNTQKQSTTKDWNTIKQEKGYSYEPEPLKTNKLAEFAKTSGYRSAAQATNTSDALTYLKQYKMADNADMLEQRNISNKNKGIAVTPRQRMYVEAAKMIDKDKLVNQSQLTKNLQQKAAESEIKLKDGNGVVANTLIDMGLAGTDMLTKAALSAVTKVPLPVVFGLAGGADTFQEDINQGKTVNQALKSGIGSGVITGGVESLTGIGASGLAKSASSKLGKSLLSKMPKGISNYLSKANSTLIGKIVGSGFGEGLEEGIEYDLQRVYRNLLYDENTPRDIKEQAYNVLIGAGVGGIFGGASAGINSVIGKRNSKLINQEYNSLEDKLPENSPTLKKIQDFRDNQVNVTDDVKMTMINAAYQELGQGNFKSQTEAVIQEMQNENSINEQTFNENINVAQNVNKQPISTNSVLDTFKITDIKNPKEVKQNIYNFYKDSIVSTSEISKPIINKASGSNIEISRATINQTFQADDKYIKAPDNEIKIAAMANITDLISNGDLQVVNTEKPSNKTTYAEINGTVSVNGMPYNVKLDVRRTDNGSKMFVHSIKTDMQNKTNGVIATGFETRIPKQDTIILDKIGQAIGKKIKIVPNIASPDGMVEDFANGQWVPDENTIEISLKANNPILVVAKHEITHTLQVESPKLYKEYKDYVINSMKENGTYERQFNYMKDLAERSGVQLSKNAIEDEIVSDATELFLTDEQSINQLASENPTLGQRIVNILKDFIKKIGEHLKGFTADWMQVNQLREAEKLWVKALNDVAQNNKLVKVKETSTENSKVMNYSLKETTKFSLKEPIEETKDLIAIHNLTEEKLKGALELGGFPVPSIAIIKAEQEHEGFGDISVIFGKDTISPTDRRNKVFASDVYSPTFPRVSFKLDEKIADNFRAKINNAAKEHDYKSIFRGYFDDDSIVDKLSRTNGDFLEAFKSEPLIKLAYLKDRGITFNPVMKRKTYGRLEPELLIEIIKKLGDKIPQKYVSFEETMKLEPELREVMNDFYSELFKDKPSFKDKKFHDSPLGFGIVSDYIDTINKYKNDTNRMEVDRRPTEEKLNKVVKQKDFENWLKDISKNIIEEKGIRNKKDTFFPSGNRRSWKQTHDAYTLENVIKLLSGSIRDEEGFNYGLGSLRANVSKEFKSIKDIKDNKNLLVSEEEFSAIKEEYSNEYFELISRAMAYHPSKYSDAYSISMAEVAKKGSFTPTALKREFKADGFKNDITNDEQLIKDSLDFLQKLKSMPTSYFEAKPQRAVTFNEVAAIVAPKTTNKELLQEMKDRNVNVLKYDEKIEGDRLKKVNSIKNVKFSLKDNQGNTLTQQQAEFFKDSKVRDNDGNLKLIYHGGTVENEFDITRGKTATQYGSGAYFTNDKGTARIWASERQGKLIEGYVNIINPFDDRVWGNLDQKSKEFKKLIKLLKEKGLDKYEINQIFRESEFSNKGTPFEEMRRILFKKTGEKYNGFGWKGAELANQLIKQAGYDGIIADLFSPGSAEQYIIFKPEQIKSIKNEKPSNNPDIRYQLKDTSDPKQIERLKRTNERLKEQFKLTKGIKLDEKSINQLARTLTKDYSSTYDKKELEIRLKLLYTQISNNEIEYEDMEAETKSIARDIIENASELNDNMYKEYTELRKTLRNTPLTIADNYKADLDSVGGYNEFRKRNLGRIHLVNEGMQIDTFYQELSEQYPELFNKDITNQADQLMLIEDILNGLVPVYENPFNRDLNEAVESLALEIFDDFTSIPEAKPTFADKQKAKLDKTKEDNKAKIKELREQQKDDIDFIKYNNKEKIKQVVTQEKEKRTNQVAAVKKKYTDQAYITWWKNKLKENDVKSHYQEMIKDLRFKKNEQLDKQASRYKERIGKIYEDRKIREAKDGIKRKTKMLDKMLRKPDKKKHIPQELEKTIAELLSMLDFTTDRQNETTILRLNDLKSQYEKIAKDSSEEGIETVADPYIVQALEYLNNKRIAEMSLQELEMLYNVVSYFDHMTRSYNKAFLNDKWIDIVDKSTAILTELDTKDPKTESAHDMVNWFKDMMNWGMVTPQMFFDRMGNTFNELWYDFRKSLDVKIMNTKTAQEYMINLLKGINIEAWTGNKAEVKTFKISSGTIELTPSQVMSLYLLNNREQARGHILGLGIKAAPIKYKEGISKKVKKQFEPVKVTPGDINTILGSMTKEQKRIADGISKFMNSVSKEWINEAQLKVYGYKTATEENYFPIKTDRNYLKSDFDNANIDPTFTSMGFLKATVKGAGNPIIIEDVFDVFTEHADKTSTYNAFIGITETTKKIINYKTKEDSIKQAMNKKYGMQAFNYLKKFMVDLQGGLRTEGGPEFINLMIRNTKRTLLGMNLRTIVQQPTAIIRASALIDSKYLIKGTAQKGNMEEMLQYSPIALWKSWGYFNLDTGRTMKDIILNTTPLLDKQYIPIQKADDLTWSKIWNAVKLEIEDTTNLRPGSNEYFNAVSERFTEIVDKTQVVDTVMHRSELMRQPDSAWKTLTAFMAEPTKSYNLLLNAKEKYKNNKTDENKNAFIRTTSAWMATTMVNTFIISLIDKWRADDEDDETILNKWFDNVLNEITGMVPIVRDLYSLIQGYSIKRMEYNGFEKIGRALQRSGKYATETFNGEKHKYPLRLITKDWIESISYVFGISTANLTREIEALMRNYMKFTGNDDGLTNDIYEFMFKK